MTTLKALSLHQPWASLLAAGYKRIETRDWRPQSLRPGQLVAIHAAKKWPPDDWEEMQSDPFFRRYLTLAQRRGLWSFTTPPLGGVVAIARFERAIPTQGSGLISALSKRELAFGNYAPGRYAWVFSEVRPVAIIPARGQQGLFEWDAPREIAALYQEPLNRMKPLTPLGPTPPEDVPDRPTQPATTATGPARVVHCRKEAFDCYIGRQMPKYPDLKASGWGNPYKDGLDTPAGRQSAIDRYREWVLTQPRLLARLPELRGRVLGCWCAPLGGLPGDLHGRVCHGEVLAALADGWCAQCQEMTSAEHVREHEAAAETFMGQVIGALTGNGQFRKATR